MFKESDQNNFAVRLPQRLTVTPPRDNSTIELKTANAVKAIQYEAVSEGQTDVTVEFYNNNGELNNQQIELKAKLNETFGNKYIPSSWSSSKNVKAEAQLTAASQGVSTVKFSVNKDLKKAKQYIIEEIKNKQSQQKIEFDTPIKNENALQRKFYSKAENAKLVETQISNVTTDSAEIKLVFDKDDAFLKDDLVTLYLEKTDQSQSIGSTTTIRTSTQSGDGRGRGAQQQQEQLEATFRFNNVLEPGRKYTIKALTSKTVDLKIDEKSKVKNPNLTSGWKTAAKLRKKRSTSSSSVTLDFITQPLISNIEAKQIDDDSATIKLEGWTKDLNDAGLTPKFTATKQQQQPNNGQKKSNQCTGSSQSCLEFKFSGLEQYTEYKDLTLKIEKSSSSSGGGNQSQQNAPLQDLTVEFVPEIQSGAKQFLRKFRTTAKNLSLATANPVTLKPLSTSSVNIEIELKDEKQASSIADVPFVLKYKKIFPTVFAESIENTSLPVLINTKTKKLTFNISNLDPGAIYEVTSAEPLDSAVKENHKISGLKPTEELLKFLKDVEGLPINKSSPDKIYFAPLNIPVKLESGWSHPIRYDYYEGEQIYIKFNKEAATAINIDWLKNNLKLELIPHHSYSSSSIISNNTTDFQSEATQGYSPLRVEREITKFKRYLTISDLKWDPETVTASLKIQPTNLKSIIGAQVKITIKNVNNYHLDPTKECSTSQSGSQQQQQQQSITFRLTSQAAIVTPINVDYMNPGLMGFTYAIYDPNGLIQPTGKEYNPFGEFPHLTPYKEQDWLKVIVNNGEDKSEKDRRLDKPDNQVNNGNGWLQALQTVKIPGPPVAVRTKTNLEKSIKYLTLYWRINSNTESFRVPSSLESNEKLWYPAGKIIHLPISLQFKTKSQDSNENLYSFVAKSPYGTPGFIMPYSRSENPHDADSIVWEGSKYQNFLRSGEKQLIPRIIKFEKNVSKVFWSAPSYAEWTTNDSVLNSVFFLNRKNPVLQNRNTSKWVIETGLKGTYGTTYSGHRWNVIYIDNKETNNKYPTVQKAQHSWDYYHQEQRIDNFSNQPDKSSWIVSMSNESGSPILYDPINYYEMLGPFQPPELPEQ
ncbi:hypothetical protein [Mycoplasma sp. 'Moose RK']|uniref:hypothetical protein n=1 Tax=Mycoplasma sp. 'Moose RK' TaxID=2780095 RepID=UPI0018C30579|nr:hypothetical protein [Mycoplasma sp. 'Moose RK']MBG0730702.1 hypothetical protein [Mycoplasma sp. 'Moose RK']